MLKKYKNRQFQLWYYGISLGQMLIRSPKDDNNKENVDISFIDVMYVELPECTMDMRIVRTKKKDIDYINKKLKSEVNIKDITVITSNKKRYYIVASGRKVEENDFDLAEVPISICVADL